MIPSNKEFGFFVLAGLFLFTTHPHVHAATPTPTPTPTCNPLSIPGTFGIPLDPLPTYVPGESLTLTIQPFEGDYPTTPTTIHWQSSFASPFDGELTEQFTFPSPGENEIFMSVGVLGHGVGPECPSWFSSGVYRARRFDFVSPTPTPTSTPTPACTRHCGNLLYPKPFTNDVPTSFVLITEPPMEFIGLEHQDGPSHPATYIGENCYLVENLLPSNTYYAYVRDCFDCNGVPIIGFAVFEVAASPELAAIPPTCSVPTVTLTPTMTPTLTPTPTPSPTPIVKPTDSPTPMPTESPTPPTPTETIIITPTPTHTPTPPPTATPAPVMGDGWIMEGAQL